MLIQGILRKYVATTDSALLVCELGDFSVYHENIKQLPEGTHPGFFEIRQIKSGTVTCNNDKGLPITAFEMVAELQALTFINRLNEPLKKRDESVETETSSASLKFLPEDEELFGELWPIGQRVKLDPACDKFRKQKERLNDLDYTYKSQDQTWIFLG